MPNRARYTAHLITAETKRASRTRDPARWRLLPADNDETATMRPERKTGDS